MKWGLKEGISIDADYGMYVFDASIVFVTSHSLLFRLALAILWAVAIAKKDSVCPKDMTNIPIITEGEIKDVPIHHLFGHPWGHYGCQKIQKNIWQIDLLSYCSNIQPKLNELQETFRCHQKWLIVGKISVCEILAEYYSTKPPNSTLLDDSASFDTPAVLKGVQIVEIS